MKRWSFVIGAAMVIIGGFALLQVALETMGITFRIWWLFWPLVLIGVGVWIIQGVTRGRAEVTREEASVPLQGATEASVRVRHGAGRLTIGAGAGPDQLLAGAFGGGLRASTTMEGGKLKVDMRVKDRDVSHYFFPWSRGWAGILDWDFTLSPDIPISLELETGASESRLSLTDLRVIDLRVKTGASSTIVDLPSGAGYTRVAVESGAASVKIRVPRGVAARIQVKSALAGIHVDTGRFPRTGDLYRSPDYDSAANKTEIFVETGVGSVDIS